MSEARPVGLWTPKLFSTVWNSKGIVENVHFKILCKREKVLFWCWKKKSQVIYSWAANVFITTLLHRSRERLLCQRKKMFILLRWLMNSLNFCINRRSPFFYYKAIEMEFDLWSSFCNKNRSMPTEKYVSFAAAATEKLNLLLSFVFFPWSYDEVQSGKATEEKPSSFELSTR